MVLRAVSAWMAGRISKKEKEKGKRTRKKEDGKEESRKSKAHLIHEGGPLILR